MEQIPSDEAIREMDGSALTLLAFRLGLAPARSMIYEHTPEERGVILFLPTRMAQWEPHTDIDHAHAVLRQMRENGWSVATWGCATGGWVRCSQRPHDATQVTCFWGDGGHGEGDTSEAMVILRACALARAHQQRTERSAQRDDIL